MGAVATRTVRTGFDPARHAPPFPNCFPAGTPVVSLRTPLGRLNLGDACHGLCGGMAFAALDGFLWGVPPPDEPTPAVVRTFARRLLESWDFPFGVLKYLDWQRRPQRSYTVAGVRVVTGLTRLTVRETWPQVQAQLDAGVPVPLGMVKASSFDPWRMPENHQVLAYGYTQTGDTVTLHVYEPNYPGDPDAAVELPLADPECPEPFAHSCEGRTVRGLFVAAYTRPDAAPGW